MATAAIMAAPAAPASSRAETRTRAPIEAARMPRSACERAAAAREAQFARQVAHGGVAVAHRHAEALDDRADEVRITVGGGKADEVGAGAGVHEGPRSPASEM